MQTTCKNLFRLSFLKRANSTWILKFDCIQKCLLMPPCKQFIAQLNRFPHLPFDIWFISVIRQMQKTQQGNLLPKSPLLVNLPPNLETVLWSPENGAAVYRANWANKLGLLHLPICQLCIVCTTVKSNGKSQLSCPSSFPKLWKIMSAHCNFAKLCLSTFQRQVAQFSFNPTDTSMVTNLPG